VVAAVGNYKPLVLFGERGGRGTETAGAGFVLALVLRGALKKAGRPGEDRPFWGGDCKFGYLASGLSPDQALLPSSVLSQGPSC